MKLKRTAADKWFSDCVRLATNWTCEYCTRDYSDNRRALDCSHFYGRANYSLRFHPLNAFAHCMGCHRKLGENPALFAEYAENQLGKHGLSILRELSQDTELGRLARKSQKEISDFYRKEFRTMERIRKAGNSGMLTFRAWHSDDNRWALDNVS